MDNSEQNQAAIQTRPDTYWSVGFRSRRTDFCAKYLLVAALVFVFFVIVPLYIAAPEFFSYNAFAALSPQARKELLMSAPKLFMWVSIPLALSFSILVVGQIRRFHDFNKPGWLCILNIVPFAIFGIIALLLAIPGTEGRNKFGEDPHECCKRRRKKKSDKKCEDSRK